MKRSRARHAHRLLAALLGALALTGCASLPGSASVCPAEAAAIAPDAGSTSTLTAECASLKASSRLAAVGGVQQTGTQTRTVGVPRGFLIAMIVLIVLVSLA